MKLPLLLLSIFLLATLSAEITFDHFEIENSTLCNNNISYINFYSKTFNDSLTPIDSINVKTSLNITAQMLENGDRNTFSIIITNFTQTNNTLFINITGSQGGKFITQTHQFKIEDCNNLGEGIIDKADKIDFKLFIYGAIILILVILIFYLISRL